MMREKFLTADYADGADKTWSQKHSAIRPNPSREMVVSGEDFPRQLGHEKARKCTKISSVFLRVFVPFCGN
jgi:hypothetical protein